ncbi:helix-turn-helix transcriptional regulator [Paenibacillus sp. GCM10023248]|uniref:helix-turn-helix transcriptional regulator n=1 Tax=unclassified Paenibacillus TaxID=185978 RepID=UPI0023780F36|nr:helix-turn-helix transcriptional regulator [Paenibacillus sp. MAHUQ-63]MDD9266011.1 helix-turn-helix transcriptional regulator [Paenibacillus sp. MAHUQ-63]
MKTEQRAARRPKASPPKKDRVQPREWFKILRLQKNVSRARMGIDLKLSENTIKNIEYGESDPSFMMAFVYALYFGVTVEELFPDVAIEGKKYFEKLQLEFAK